MLAEYNFKFLSSPEQTSSSKSTDKEHGGRSISSSTSTTGASSLAMIPTLIPQVRQTITLELSIAEGIQVIPVNVDRPFKQYLQQQSLLLKMQSDITQQLE